MTNLKHTLVAAVAVAALSAGTAVAQDDIMVAGVGPLTGSEATFGEQLKRGATLAVDNINAKGGLLGKKIKITFEDDACDPKQAVAAANKVVGAKVVAVFGHYCSSSSIPASAVYQQAGNIIQISPASTNPRFTDEAATKKWRHVFRTVGRDDLQGTVAGRWLAANFKGKKIAIIHDKSTYGEGLAKETKKALNAAGVKEAVYDSYTKGDKDFAPVLSKLKAAGVDVIYVGGYDTEAGLMLRQAKDMGYNVPFISGDAQATDNVWKIAGDAAKNLRFTFNPDYRKNPAAKEVVAQFAAAKYDPEGYTLTAYAAVEVWAQAVAKAKSVKMADVAKNIHNQTFKTVIGTLNYDNKGDLKNAEYVWFTFDNGKYVELPTK